MGYNYIQNETCIRDNLLCCYYYNRKGSVVEGSLVVRLQDT